MEARPGPSGRATEKGPQTQFVDVILRQVFLGLLDKGSANR
jgi:hypothetical protein